ncbi:hypothetical protein U1Q18_007798 [Sarracenia purpurea var. burkii]
MANQRGKIYARGSLRDQVADNTRVLSSRFHVLCSSEANELEFAKQEPKSKEKGLSILKEADSIRKSLLRLNDLPEDEAIVVRSVAKSIEDEVNVLRKGTLFPNGGYQSKLWRKVGVPRELLNRGGPLRLFRKGIEDKSENEIDLGKSVLKTASSSVQNFPLSGSEEEYEGESSCDGSEGELEENSASIEDEEDSSVDSGEELETKSGEGKEGKERDDVNHGQAEGDVAVPQSLELTQVNSGIDGSVPNIESFFDCLQPVISNDVDGLIPKCKDGKRNVQAVVNVNPNSSDLKVVDKKPHTAPVFSNVASGHNFANVGNFPVSLGVDGEKQVGELRNPSFHGQNSEVNGFATKEEVHQVFDGMPQRPNRPKSWANIVAKDSFKYGSSRLNNRCPSGSKLDFFPPKDPSHPGVIDIEDDLIDEKLWKSYLVGYFLDASLAFGLVRATAMTLWRN